MTEGEFHEPTPAQEPTAENAAPSPFDNLDFDAIFAEIAESDDVTLLERTVSDPYIENAHNEVRRYNEILAQEGIVSIDESTTIESKLDEHWRELLEEYVQVTGTVHIEHEDIDKDVSVNAVPMLSRGFTVQGNVFQKDGTDDYHIEDPVVKHVFKVRRGDVDPEAKGKAAKKKVWAYADVDSVHVETEGVTPERAAAWLESTYPELFEELNDRMFNTTGDEGATLLSLKELDFTDYVPIDDDFTRECVQTYIQDTVDLDNLIFYSVGVEGPYKFKYKNKAQEDDPTDFNKMLQDSALAFAYGPYVDCKIDEGNPDKWDLIVEFAVMTPEKNEPPVVIRISLDNVKAMQSIRAAYYGK